VTDAQFDALRPSHLCRHCGQRKGLHGGNNNPHRPRACPPNKPFPRWSNHIEKRDGKGAAAALYDKRVAHFWTRTTTSFEPATHWTELP
jgi:hypothetical protein